MTTSTGPAPDLAIVIPALNERDNLELLLPAVKEVLGDLNVTAEIVVADGGSHDGTREAAERREARVVIQQERGYGGALLRGFAASPSPLILTIDDDLSHPPMFLEENLRRRDEAEVLLPSRDVEG